MSEQRSALPAAWEPRIVAFFCSWCTYAAADMVGLSRTRYPSSVRVIRVMCSGRVDPYFVLQAFARGADGVLIGGCHSGDCHYIDGNHLALRRFLLLRRLLEDMGIEADRFRLEWFSAAEGEKLRRALNTMVEDVRALGPLGLPSGFAALDSELADLGEVSGGVEETVHAR